MKKDYLKSKIMFFHYLTIPKVMKIEIKHFYMMQRPQDTNGCVIILETTKHHFLPLYCHSFIFHT